VGSRFVPTSRNLPSLLTESLRVCASGSLRIERSTERCAAISDSAGSRPKQALQPEISSLIRRAGRRSEPRRRWPRLAFSAEPAGALRETCRASDRVGAEGIRTVGGSNAQCSRAGDPSGDCAASVALPFLPSQPKSWTFTSAICETRFTGRSIAS
jgi:hypothetical protein